MILPAYDNRYIVMNEPVFGRRHWQYNLVFCYYENKFEYNSKTGF